MWKTRKVFVGVFHLILIDGGGRVRAAAAFLIFSKFDELSGGSNQTGLRFLARIYQRCAVKEFPDFFAHLLLGQAGTDPIASWELN